MTKKDTHINNTDKAGQKKVLPWFTAVLMVIGIAIIAALYWNQTVTVEDIELSGVYFTEEEEVISRASIPAGVKPDSLDLDEIVTLVEKLNYVRKVIPYVEPSGDLRLEIQERQPLALLVDGSRRVYVDAEGVKLPILEGKNRNLPLVYGFDARALNDTLNSVSFRQISSFLQSAKADGFGWATISEIAFDVNDGVVALSHENGVKLLFGRDDFKTKLENWQAFYTEVIKTKGIGSMQQVDLRFSNQVVTREG